jgi:CubicO group peptidase (beta-lactamase class C family)
MKPDFSAVDSIFAGWDKTTSPGCALAIVQDGTIIYKRGYGMANLDLGVPIRSEMIFDIGSTSKQFTAMSIVILARRGLLKLDDPIQKYLPEIPDYGDKITVQHMLNHTSGLRDYLGLMYMAGLPFWNDYQEKEVVELIASQNGLNFKPGSEYLYSNSGYFLLSEIVERVSGKNLRVFAEENLFSPLGMKHTHFHNNFKEIVPNRASAYSPLPEGGFEIDMGIFDVLGDGALYTSVEDLFIWDQNFYHNILDGGGQELIQQMETTAVLNDGKKIDYASGLRVSSYRGLKVVEHGGAWYGYRAALTRFPDQHFSVICLANLATMNPSSLAYRVADVLLVEKFTEAAPQAVEGTAGKGSAIPLESFTEWLGKFQSKEMIVEVSIQENSLMAETMGEKFKLQIMDGTHWKAVGIPNDISLTLEPQVEGAPRVLTLNIEKGYMVESLHQIPAYEPDLSALAQYCGSYHSSELNTTYHLEMKDGKLHLEAKNIPYQGLKPVRPDEFDGGIFSILFVRDNQVPSAFILDAGRIKGIRFERV